MLQHVLKGALCKVIVNSESPTLPVNRQRRVAVNFQQNKMRVFRNFINIMNVSMFTNPANSCIQSCSPEDIVENILEADETVMLRVYGSTHLESLISRASTHSGLQAM